jgi:hypothetical protein
MTATDVGNASTANVFVATDLLEPTARQVKTNFPVSFISNNQLQFSFQVCALYCAAAEELTAEVAVIAKPAGQERNAISPTAS